MSRKAAASSCEHRAQLVRCFLVPEGFAHPFKLTIFRFDKDAASLLCSCCPMLRLSPALLTR
jgi:hypothetical protein